MLHIQLDIIYLAFCCYLHHQFFNHHRYRADGILILVLRQALSVVRHPKQHPTQIQVCMTLPTRPTLFLAHCKAHKTPTESQPCKELKMPTHNPPTLADEYLSSFVQYFSNKSLLNTQARPAPNLQTLNNLVLTITVKRL